ncbi:signal transduction histidine kinase [Evansella vedderi]|uniref:histidine kinase n=1 Tax=Evansella vedderi TaxID=38282 RepID=A0ABT9ZYV1_9BACI|nr:ATP-binding protein [Evansella vedderi]MDQ0256424.1 signal transduction histidine kinase [Evansella vedderi]
MYKELNYVNEKLDMIRVLENINEPCLFLNNKWKIEFINDEAETFYKEQNSRNRWLREELLGTNFWDVFSDYVDTMEYKLIHEAYKEKQIKEFKFLTKYSKRWIKVKVIPNAHGVVILFHDLTLGEETEKQRIFYEKLNAIREMAAGVAHEIRNPITTVKGFLQILEQNEGNEKYKDIYKLLIDEINRVNGLITEFLDISKDKSNKKEHQDLNEIISTLFPLIETRAIKEGKLVELQLSEISKLFVDKNEIRQLLLNLINNALDAIVAKKSVKVSTYEEHNEIILSIADEGSGIPPHLIGSIENFFFTTKEEGTGLGLPICFSIAKRNNGRIDYLSSSKGTTFNVYFLKTLKNGSPSE